MAPRMLPALVSAVLLFANIGLTGASWAQSADPSDPPARVGRLSFVEGSVQQRTADAPDWAGAALNYPVTNGFAVATQEGGRAEIQVGSMAVRLGSASELDINNLGDDSATLTLAQGEINVRLGHLDGARIEIVTPRGAIDIVRAGDYHFDAGTTDSPTRVAVFRGEAQVERNDGPLDVPNGQAALISGDDASDIQFDQASPDPLDDWAAARDRPRRAAPGPISVAPPPISVEMTGAGDLDDYGRWNSEPSYGSIWYPTAVPVGWAPYHYGHWAWVSPWGWTWVDDQPWGFAPFHYGRWVYTPVGWGWVPGVVVARPVYAPALVAFIGSPGIGISVGIGAGVGWFPLAPREVYVPSYPVSVNYVRNVNVTNVTNINTVNITKVNNTIVVNNNNNTTVNNYANHHFATVVPAAEFASGKPVHQVAVQPTTDFLNKAATMPVSHTPPAVAAHPIAPAALPHSGNGNASQGGTANNANNGPGQNNGADQERNHPVHSLPTLPAPQGGATATTNATTGPGNKGPGNTTVKTNSTVNNGGPNGTGVNGKADTNNANKAGQFGGNPAANNQQDNSQQGKTTRGGRPLPTLPGSSPAIANKSPATGAVGPTGGSNSRVQSPTVSPGQNQPGASPQNSGGPGKGASDNHNRQVVTPSGQQPGQAGTGQPNGNPAKGAGGPSNTATGNGGRPLPTLPGSNPAIANKTPATGAVGPTGGSNSRVQSPTVSPGQNQPGASPQNSGGPGKGASDNHNRQVVTPSGQQPGQAGTGQPNGNPAKGAGGPSNAATGNGGKPGPGNQPPPNNPKNQSNQKGTDKPESFNSTGAPPAVVRGGRQGNVPVLPAAIPPAAHASLPLPPPAQHVTPQAPPQHVIDQAPLPHVINQAPPPHVVNQSPPQHVVNQAPPQHVVNQAPPPHVTPQAPPQHIANQGPPPPAAQNKHGGNNPNQNKDESQH